MKREGKKLLHDVLTACDKIMRYTDNMSSEGWFEDDKTQQAVERNFEIIGEALNRLSQQNPEIAERIPDLSRSIGLRIKLAHHYHAIDPKIVWNTVNNNVPELHAVVRKLMAELDPRARSEPEDKKQEDPPAPKPTPWDDGFDESTKGW